MELKKINQVCAVRTTENQNHLFEDFRVEFGYLLNPEAGSVGRSGADWFYLRDDKIHRALTGIVDFPMNSVAVLLGGSGIGKTSAIKDVFGRINNEIVIDEEKGVLIVPIFFQRWLREVSDGTGEENGEVTRNIVKTILAACEVMEEKIPGLGAWAKSDEGMLALYSFIKGTNPKALVNYEDLRAHDIGGKLHAAYTKERFIYAASQLKLYLSSRNSVHRILLIVDGIESLPQGQQDEAMRQFLRLFRCLRNYPVWWKGSDVFISLLFSLRPETYSRAKSTGTFESYKGMTEIKRWAPFDLMKYFEKKLAVLPDSTRNHPDYRWDDALSILRVLCTKYEGKFAQMILGLSGQDIRLALEMCGVVLQSTWTTRDPFTERRESGQRYGFNNISIIRALSCNDRLVYFGDDGSYIPNVLENTETEDNAIIALYVMAYFVPKKQDDKMDGKPIIYFKGESLTEKRDILIRDFMDVFGNDLDGEGDFESRLTATVNRLISQGVIKEDLGTLSLTMKGMEIWFMLSQDSVLAEVFREARFRDVEKAERESLMSSNELMDGDSKNQDRVFKELLRDIHEFKEKEEDFITAAKGRKALPKYKSLFGSPTMTGHLLSGVKCSMDFSGKINDLFGDWNDLYSKIQSLIGE